MRSRSTLIMLPNFRLKTYRNVFHKANTIKNKKNYHEKQDNLSVAHLSEDHLYFCTYKGTFDYICLWENSVFFSKWQNFFTWAGGNGHYNNPTSFGFTHKKYKASESGNLLRQRLQTQIQRWSKATCAINKHKWYE